LFGAVEAEETTSYDPERLERQNDAEIDGINERAKHLKEVRSQAFACSACAPVLACARRACASRVAGARRFMRR
jgi:hypothetical protein